MKQKLLFLVAILLAFAVLPASAQQGVGTTPYVARLLTTGLNVGSLAPGESFWYSFSRSDMGSDVQSVILELVFKPGDSRTARQVTFDVYTFDQVASFLETGQPRGLKEGSGQLVEADFDPNTAERLWAGAVNADEVYYVHVQNAADLTADYHLTALPQTGKLPATAPAAGASLAARNTAKNTAVPALDPANPDSKWALTAQALQGMSTEEAAQWMKNAAAMGWFGMAQPETLAAATESTHPAAVPETTAIAAQPVADNSVYPNNPLVLLNRNANQLAPGSEHWYAFIKNNFDDKLFEEMALTLFSTPGDGNLTNQVNFEIFTGDQYGVWLRGTPDEMKNMGAGMMVERDGDPNTGEHVWKGTILDGDRYYVRVRNDSNAVVDYYLLQGDVINTRLGDAPNGIRVTSVLPADKIQEVVVPNPVPPGTDIANPKPAQLGSQRGFLKPGEDVWYTFRFQNFERKEPEQRHYTMYLKESPGQGYIANDVNVEIYTYPQLNIWLRGDGDKMTPMGVGDRQIYDPKMNTQLFAWDGFFVSDTTYFVRVRNDSRESIFYDLEIQRH